MEVLFEQYDEIRVAFTDGNFGGPTLFIQGGNSDYITPADHSQILKLFPKAQFESIPHAGHWIHADQPELFYQETTRFLTETSF
jgi:pimeloyl-ACP methyl ester carboxylesterase